MDVNLKDSNFFGKNGRKNDQPQIPTKITFPNSCRMISPLVLFIKVFERNFIQQNNGF